MKDNYTLDEVKAVLSEPAFPKFKNPTRLQQIAIDAYTACVVNRFELIMFIRQTKPNWLPEFSPIY
jgi:hypothetical protein